MPLLPYLHRVASRENLPAHDAQQAMLAILDGTATSPQIAAFLVALKMKGETSDEILGFARAMRARAPRVPVPPDARPLIDTCGTGGDGQGTFNISTLVAFVAAGAGVRVAKHGNRSLSGPCGSADLLEALGVKVTLTPEQAADCLAATGIAFLFAPALHPAMKHAQQARIDLKMRTAFNLLGPLTNPAGATAQLVGAPSPAAADLMAKALACLGLQKGFVVHGSDGLDEITTTGPTFVLEVSKGAIADHTLTPEDFGVPRARPEDLKGAGVDENTSIAHAVLKGEPGPRRDIVLVNAAAALVAAGVAPAFPDGVALAAQSLDSGAAREKLAALAAFTARL